jgi:hypothetical protein
MAPSLDVLGEKVKLGPRRAHAAREVDGTPVLVKNA